MKIFSKKYFFSFLFPFQTESIVEIHERHVLHWRKLRRDESEASGDEN